jgi:hypothetical protein
MRLLGPRRRIIGSGILEAAIIQPKIPTDYSQRIITKCFLGLVYDEEHSMSSLRVYDLAREKELDSRYLLSDSSYNPTGDKFHILEDAGGVICYDFIDDMESMDMSEKVCRTLRDLLLESGRKRMRVA